MLNMGQPVFKGAYKIGFIVDLFLIFWVLALVIGFFIIRKEFLARKTVLEIMDPKDELFDNLVEEYTKM
jgi:uncharacterized membrane protein (Fun14 family)